MKEFKGLIYLVLLVTVCILSMYGIYLNAEANKKNLAIQQIDAYPRGFSAGFNATIRNIKFNTNAGSFTIEMTNVLNELGPMTTDSNGLRWLKPSLHE